MSVLFSQPSSHLLHSHQVPAFAIPLLPSLPAVCSILPGMVRFDILLTSNGQPVDGVYRWRRDKYTKTSDEHDRTRYAEA